MTWKCTGEEEKKCSCKIGNVDRLIRPLQIVLRSHASCTDITFEYIYIGLYFSKLDRPFSYDKVDPQVVSVYKIEVLDLSGMFTSFRTKRSWV